MTDPSEFYIAPAPDVPGQTQAMRGLNQDGKWEEQDVILEYPLTLFLNKQEIVTLMTATLHKRELAVGYLLNQNLLSPSDEITGIDIDDELGVIVVRTAKSKNLEDALAHRTKTSGCGQGTVFGNQQEKLKNIRLDDKTTITTNTMVTLLQKINTYPSLYLKAGAIHGCALCHGDRPLIYLEDIGRHNAVDAIAGFMHRDKISPTGKCFFTTGRLTSEMVIKCVQMQIPILISRSGFTAWGVELARQTGLTLIGRARGKRFLVMSGENRVILNR